MGTLGYMPTEQARGEVHWHGPHSDVFSLGAILCTIITGRPPHIGHSFDSLLRKHQSGDLTEVKFWLANNETDPLLDSLVLDCLQDDPERRPIALSLLTRVESYLAEARERERKRQISEKLAEELAKQEKEHQRKLSLEVADAEAASLKLGEERERKKRLALMALVLILVCVGSAAAYFSFEPLANQRVDRRLEAQEQSIFRKKISVLVNVKYVTTLRNGSQIISNTPPLIGYDRAGRPTRDSYGGWTLHPGPGLQAQGIPGGLGARGITGVGRGLGSTYNPSVFDQWENSRQELSQMIGPAEAENGRGNLALLSD